MLIECPVESDGVVLEPPLVLLLLASQPFAVYKRFPKGLVSPRLRAVCSWERLAIPVLLAGQPFAAPVAIPGQSDRAVLKALL